MKYYLLEHSPKFNPGNLNGEVVMLFGAEDRRPRLFDFDDYTRAVAKALKSKGFDPETDRVVLTGSQVGMFQLGLVLGGLYDKLRFCAFDARDGSYEDITWAK